MSPPFWSAGASRGVLPTAGRRKRRRRCLRGATATPGLEQVERRPRVPQPGVDEPHREPRIVAERVLEGGDDAGVRPPAPQIAGEDAAVGACPGRAVRPALAGRWAADADL